MIVPVFKEMALKGFLFVTEVDFTEAFRYVTN